jgi:predicted  nucleic acid-binding Zn-ribbon protein
MLKLNFKKSYQEELELEHNKRLMNKTVESGLDLRVQELESRLTELTQRNANFEHERFDLQSKIEELEKHQTAKLEQTESTEVVQPVTNTKLAFLKLYEKLKMSEDFDIFG